MGAQHYESWVRKSGVRNPDRSIYEHASLCPALSLMVSYDQLNVPSLASAEALDRRRALIEVAEAPYEASEEMGVSEN